jgi:hypothetical protein
MNDDLQRPDDDRNDADQALDALRRAGRVDFALRIARSLQATGTSRPLAMAFQQMVSPLAPPERDADPSRGAGS